MQSLHALIVAGSLVTAIVLPGPAAGQPRPPEPTKGAVAPAPAPPPGPVMTEADAEETRQQLQEVMRKYPPSLGRVLKSDPTLLQDAAYPARYPALAAFLAAHPEVANNPAYYFGYVYVPGDPEPQDAQSRAISLWRNMLEGISVLVVMVFVATLFTWLVKTVLNHRRWLRLSRVQNEVHNKLLDRFTGAGELLSYVQTSAGRRFLEAAPIDVDVAERGLAAPVGRILWSVQVGVVLAVGGLGIQFVSGRVVQEVAEGLWMIGVLAMAFGVGFVLSGGISYYLARRLGLLDPAAPAGAAATVDHPAP